MAKISRFSVPAPLTPWLAQYPSFHVARTVADPTDGDKGDIVVSDAGQIWMIDADVLSAWGRTLIDDPSASSGLTTLGAAPATAVGDSPPVAPITGQLWWESDTGQLYLYYDDGSSSQWVAAVGSAGSAASDGTITVLPGEDLQAAIDALSTAGGGTIRLGPGTFTIATPITLKSNVFIEGTPGGTTIAQTGQYAFINPSGSFITQAGVSKLKFAYSGPASAHNCALYLRAHSRCKFIDLDFSGYDAIGIMTRKADGVPGSNTVFNIYQRWYVEKCLWFSYDQGLDESYSEYTGNGSTTAFATTWNFTWPADVAVGVWKADGSLVKPTLTTDYTVSGGAGGTGTVTFLVAPAVGDVVMLWPSVANNRISPISGNSFDDIAVRRAVKFGIALIRWVDSETYRKCYIQVTSNGAADVICNPFTNGNGETDINNFQDCTFVYGTAVGEVTDEASVRMFNLGPGSQNTTGTCKSDGSWGTQMQVLDTSLQQLTGTVATTNGSPIVTGTGTKFTEQLTLIGATKDRIVINGVLRGIASIDSNTQITTTVNWGTTQSGQTAFRSNGANAVSYDLWVSDPGALAFAGNCRFQYKLSSFASGTATLAAATTYTVIYDHVMWRAPTLDEIRVTMGVGSISWFVAPASLSITQFVITFSAAVTGDIGWSVTLADYT